MEKIGLPVYGLLDNSIFGSRIIFGIVTGIRFTSTNPLYEVSFRDNIWWTPIITEDVNDIPKLLELAPLSEIKKTSFNGLKIKFEK